MKKRLSLISLLMAAVMLFTSCAAVQNIYQGSALQQAQEEVLSQEKSASAPSKITGLYLKGRAADALRIAWNKNTSADGYIVEQKDGTTWKRIAKITSNATTEYRIAGLKAGTAYSFRVKAYKMSGSTALYSSYSSGSWRTYPSAMKSFALKLRSNNYLTLSWAKNTSADGYIIEKKVGSTWQRITKITNNATTEYKVTGLAAGTAYNFRIRAYKMSGSTALYSGYTNGSWRTSPNGVQGFTLKGRATDALRLGWNKNTSADGYIIEQKVGTAWQRVVKITNNSTTEYRVGGLKPGTEYSFRIQAYKMSGSTALYSILASNTWCTTPAAVTGLKATDVSYDGVTITWNHNSTVSGYDVEEYYNGKWVMLTSSTVVVTKPPLTINMPSGTTAQFRITPYIMQGSTKVKGGSATITLSTLKDPTAKEGWHGASYFRTPDPGKASTEYQGTGEFATGADGINFDVTYRRYYVTDIRDDSIHWTDEIKVWLNKRDYLRFGFAAGGIATGSETSPLGAYAPIITADLVGIWHGNGQQTYNTTSHPQYFKECYMRAQYVDYTGKTPSLFYFRLETPYISTWYGDYYSKWEGLFSVYLTPFTGSEVAFCHTCGGTGRCTVCGGSGKWANVTCQGCHGDGKCWTCKGKGKLNSVPGVKAEIK
ncbi:MAG: fibronectin type III domain-containing protein [Eubacterium sp.]|nr:fibronectin type III domain-containing protein [Eubacterium sp.]